MEQKESNELTAQVLERLAARLRSGELDAVLTEQALPHTALPLAKEYQLIKTGVLVTTFTFANPTLVAEHAALVRRWAAENPEQLVEHMLTSARLPSKGPLLPEGTQGT